MREVEAASSWWVERDWWLVEGGGGGAVDGGGVGDASRGLWKNQGHGGVVS